MKKLISMIAKVFRQGQGPRKARYKIGYANSSALYQSNSFSVAASEAFRVWMANRAMPVLVADRRTGRVWALGA